MTYRAPATHRSSQMERIPPKIWRIQIQWRAARTNLLPKFGRSTINSTKLSNVCRKLKKAPSLTINRQQIWTQIRSKTVKWPAWQAIQLRLKFPAQSSNCTKSNRPMTRWSTICKDSWIRCSKCNNMLSKTRSSNRTWIRGRLIRLRACATPSWAPMKTHRSTTRSLRMQIWLLTPRILLYQLQVSQEDELTHSLRAQVEASIDASTAKVLVRLPVPKASATGRLMLESVQGLKTQ